MNFICGHLVLVMLEGQREGYSGASCLNGHPSLTSWPLSKCKTPSRTWVASWFFKVTSWIDKMFIGCCLTRLDQTSNLWTLQEQITSSSKPWHHGDPELGWARGWGRGERNQKFLGGRDSFRTRLFQLPGPDQSEIGWSWCLLTRFGYNKESSQINTLTYCNLIMKPFWDPNL